MEGSSVLSDKKVAVILPSRGLIFSETAEEILNNLKGIPHKFCFAHKLPIPDCFEEPTKKALSDTEVTHLWFVEDDMIIPQGVLQEMLEMDVAVVTADYPINDKGRGAVFSDKGGKILITGTGCLLVKREVIAEMKPPIFRTDIRWNIKNMGDYIKLTGTKTGQIDGYGLHDVNFCMNLHRLNIPIHKIETRLGQRKLVSLGKSGSNDGAHNIIEWHKIKKDCLLKEVMKWPVQETGNLVTVETPSGEILVSKSHAKTLVAKGLGKIPPKRYSVIDWGDL
jgi:hypothetical protein